MEKRLSLRSPAEPDDASEPPQDGAGLAMSEAVTAPLAATPRPPSRFDGPLDTRWKRIDAWLNMLFVDHGFFRLAHLNLHRVGARAWRSAQPAPHQIARFKRLGVKTVVSLRGGRHFGSYPLEREACARHGLAFEEITLRSREAPRKETLEEVIALLERIEYPALFHCKAGADRAGLMSALYLLLQEEAPLEVAQAQLGLKFGHVRQGPTGVLDAFLEAYAAADARKRARKGRGMPFKRWIDRRYRRGRVNREFQASRWGRMITDRLLRRE